MICLFGCHFYITQTTGLDSRSAMLIVRLLRRICTESQRTIVATIHQPSSAVFELFDDLLLLKAGGEVTYQGPLGKDSRNMIAYFERLGARPIELGDNPANWVLRVLQDAADGSSNLGDLADCFKHSSEYADLTININSICTNAKEQERIHYDSKFATGYFTRQYETVKRLQTLYWRSPTYSGGRVIVSLILAMFLGTVFVHERKNVSWHPSFLRNIWQRIGSRKSL
jgi:energy-coupling factor transporter ATP-binding protein EcfA2